MPIKNLRDLEPDSGILERNNKGVNVTGTIRNLHFKLASENIEVRANASEIHNYLVACGASQLYYGTQNPYRRNVFSKVVDSALSYLEKSGTIGKENRSYGSNYHLGYATQARESEEVISRHNGYAIADEYVDILTKNEYMAILNYVIFGNPNGYGDESHYHGNEHLESARRKVKQAKVKEG